MTKSASPIAVLFYSPRRVSNCMRLAPAAGLSRNKTRTRSGLFSRTREWRINPETATDQECFTQDLCIPPFLPPGEGWGEGIEKEVPSFRPPHPNVLPERKGTESTFSIRPVTVS
ncbi:protein of unknown function [Methylocaldum szegediense]|uniref:Uncharacterized protein n=1 Tax=Methylocaldum szegediense TaxID=73780 RepID=A0ABM9I3M3_9GAMM|nr:protein of unknown function [Methylocaldum szegediense]